MSIDYNSRRVLLLKSRTHIRHFFLCEAIIFSRSEENVDSPRIGLFRHTDEMNLNFASITILEQ